jgi:hypothetical protein
VLFLGRDWIPPLKLGLYSRVLFLGVAALQVVSWSPEGDLDKEVASRVPRVSDVMPSGDNNKR